MPSPIAKPKPGERIKRMTVDVSVAQWRKIERIRKAFGKVQPESTSSTVRRMIEAFPEDAL